MNTKYLAVALAALSTHCLAYDCLDSDAYKSGVASAREANHSNGVQLGVAVKYLQKTEGIGFDQALKKVMQTSSPEILAQDDQLADVAAKIKASKPQSEDECVALLQLQQQYGAIGRRKIDLIVKGVMGQASQSDN
ncbi:conserved exported protein of unknown function [Pararobbsia alpina]|uniref:hypothetical protein n=1 Tax=Pararobbsia alpina TaxID=621374 RepID=UPI0039A6B480